MWPWEHLAFGYLAYSGSTHLRQASGPAGGAALSAAVGTQFPDLVDKPLSWTLGVLPAGVFVHSLFVAVPLAAGLFLLGRRRGRGELALAFGVGYGSHLLGDAVYPALRGGAVATWFLLWPAVDRPGGSYRSGTAAPGSAGGVLDHAGYYLTDYLAALASPGVLLYVGLEVGFLLAAVALWRYDGLPGARRLRSALE